MPKYTLPLNKQFARNSIPDQRLSYANQLTVQQWNNIINILKKQANENTAYLQMLHTWLVGSGASGSADVPEGTLFEYIINIGTAKADKTYVDAQDKALFTATANALLNKVDLNSNQIITGKKTFNKPIEIIGDDINGRLYPTVNNTGMIGQPSHHFNLGYINKLRSYQVLPILQDGTDPATGAGEVGSSSNRWLSGYIDNIYAKVIKLNDKDVATQEYVYSLLSNLSSLDLQPVDTLPTENISTTSIYLLKSNNTEETNIYEEYIYVNDKWELIGTTKVDIMENMSDAEGIGAVKQNGNKAPGGNAFATGYNTHAGQWTGSMNTLAEGVNTVGNYAHAEGNANIAHGSASHAEGKKNLTWGEASHAEGYNNVTWGVASHVEGQSNVATGNRSHAEGYHTTATHEGAHTQGKYTTSGRNYQTVLGEYNEVVDDALLVVGNGTSESDRRNAFEVKQDGTVKVNGKNITDISNSTGGSIVKTYTTDFRETAWVRLAKITDSTLAAGTFTVTIKTTSVGNQPLEVANIFAASCRYGYYLDVSSLTQTPTITLDSDSTGSSSLANGLSALRIEKLNDAIYLCALIHFSPDTMSTINVHVSLNDNIGFELPDILDRADFINSRWCDTTFAPNHTYTLSLHVTLEDLIKTFENEHPIKIYFDNREILILDQGICKCLANVISNNENYGYDILNISPIYNLNEDWWRTTDTSTGNILSNLNNSIGKHGIITTIFKTIAGKIKASCDSSSGVLFLPSGGHINFDADNPLEYTFREVTSDNSLNFKPFGATNLSLQIELDYAATLMEIQIPISYTDETYVEGIYGNFGKDIFIYLNDEKIYENSGFKYEPTGDPSMTKSLYNIDESLKILGREITSMKPMLSGYKQYIELYETVWDYTIEDIAYMIQMIPSTVKIGVPSQYILIPEFSISPNFDTEISGDYKISIHYNNDVFTGVVSNSETLGSVLDMCSPIASEEFVNQAVASAGGGGKVYKHSFDIEEYGFADGNEIYLNITFYSSSNTSIFDDNDYHRKLYEFIESKGCVNVSQFGGGLDNEIITRIFASTNDFGDGVVPTLVLCGNRGNEYPLRLADFCLSNYIPIEM